MATARNPKRRVKVYQLNGEGLWLDRGTGFLQVIFSDASHETYFQVKNELNDELLLHSRIYSEDVYQLQQDTLIVWQEPDTQRDVALSFQESAGCMEVWDLLGALRSGTLSGPSTSLGGGGGGGGGGVGGSASSVGGHGSVGGSEGGDTAWELPAVSVANLSAIVEAVLSHVQTSHEVEPLCLWILKTGYHVRLFQLFDECERAGNEEALGLLFRIWRALLFANNVTLLELILGEDCIMHFFGALEYDPRIAPERRVRHRAFLRETHMREVVPFSTDELRGRIRQTYLMAYLRDVILAGIIDDQLCATINSFVMYNQMDIVALVRRDPEVLQQVTTRMKDPDDPDASFLDKLSFLHELCTLAKVCNMAGRVELYGLLSHLGVFHVLQLALRRDNTTIRTLACEVINLTLAHNVTLLRQYVLTQTPAASFLLLLVDGVVSEPDLGLKAQFIGILQALLDPEGMDKSTVKEQMLGLWYEHCMVRLVEPLERPVDEDVVAKEYVMEMLEFCIRYHEYRIKYFILGNGVTRRVAQLMDHRDRVLQLAAVRLIRTIIAIRDSFFDRHLIRHRFFDSVIALLVRNGGANNLIDSAILEMLHFVLTAPLPDLAQDIVSRHRDTLLAITYVDVCTKLVAFVDERNKALGKSSASAGSDSGAGATSADGDGASAEADRKRRRGDGNDDEWLEEVDDDAAGAAGDDSRVHLELPSVLGHGRGSGGGSDDDEDDMYGSLIRHDTPPLSFDLLGGSGSGGADGARAAGGGASTTSAAAAEVIDTTTGQAFSSLRLPMEAGALVAGLAAEATRLVAEASAGGPFWEAGFEGANPLVPSAASQPLPASPAPGAVDELRKRRRVEEPSPPTSLLDEFMRDAGMNSHLDQ